MDDLDKAALVMASAILTAGVVNGIIEIIIDLIFRDDDYPHGD